MRGEDLAWQQRKGTSFVFTPKFCGYQVAGRPGDRGDARRSLQRHNGIWPGYRQTPSLRLPGAGGISLGTAMAISGAAASPNEGYHSSPATAFLMTVFDVRLGWWLGNPATRKYRQSAPRSPYLSGAGVVRLDGLAQPLRISFRRRTFRKSGRLRTGAPSLPLHHCLRRRPGWRSGIWRSRQCDSKVPHGHGRRYRDRCRQHPAPEGNGMSKWHCAIGTIHYETLGEGATPGTLVYIKSSLTGEELPTC